MGGELDNKYKATPYPCPVMQPIGLHVVMATGLEVLAVGQKVNFTLTQEGVTIANVSNNTCLNCIKCLNYTNRFNQ